MYNIWQIIPNARQTVFFEKTYLLFLLKNL